MRFVSVGRAEKWAIKFEPCFIGGPPLDDCMMIMMTKRDGHYKCNGSARAVEKMEKDDSLDCRLLGLLHKRIRLIIIIILLFTSRWHCVTEKTVVN